MLNPYALLAALLAFLAAVFGAYQFGKHVCEGEHAVDVVESQEQVIDNANTDVDAATARAVAQAKAEAAARLSAVTVRLKGERDAALKAKPECARDATSLGLLNDAVDLANGQTATTDTLPDPVQPVTETTGR